jgi:hypothetical protein
LIQYKSTGLKSLDSFSVVVFNLTVFYSCYLFFVGCLFDVSAPFCVPDSWRRNSAAVQSVLFRRPTKLPGYIETKGERLIIKSAAKSGG